NEAFASAGVDKYTIDAYWLGTAMSGNSGITLARPLQVEGKPVTHVENFCATGSEALRGAAYAVASGAYDIAMAVGVEKVKDSGYQGAVGAGKVPTDGTDRTLTAAADDAYRQAGVADPRHELAMAEVHDCFTPTEMVLMEDLGFAERGTAWKEVLAGSFDLDGDLPVNPDGGLKSFGHPIGASGLRMIFEAWLQLRGEAPEERRLGNSRPLALTHNLGGYPGEMVSFVGIVGTELG